MKFINTILTFLIVCTTISITDYTFVSAQADSFTPTVKVGGQVRYRGEIDMRFFDMNAKPLFINMLRTRLDAKAFVSPNISAFIQFQDSRNFGETNSRAWRGTLDGSSDNIDLHQGYVEFNDLGIENLTVRVGRMMFNLNNERLIGSLDWHNIGRGFDGGFAAYKFADGWQARAFGFVLGSQELLMTSSAPQIPKMLGGFDFNIPYIPSMNAFIYYDQNDRAISGLGPGIVSSMPKLSRYTIGFYTKNESEGFIWELESAFQSGSIDTLPRLANNTSSDISAYMVSAFGGWKKGNFTIGGGLDLMTGDNPETDEFEGFDHLFSTIHKFYGGMDLFPFSVLPNAGIRPAPEGTNKGILMPNVRLTWSPDSRWKLDAHIMNLRTFSPYKFEDTDLFSLGTEIDLVATCNVAKGVSAQFGSSFFLPGEILEKTNGSKGMGTDPAYWGYTMIIVNF
ncbi:MAG: alginate export family protein [Candidatus Kapabacteria bacterium]|nr:alginate export family protein [Ignavibacteriota bacterium]MCW5884519.1 alginate export family protein [Candidatus Kapabacteria bacterium]